jgi:hypothetical protein
VNERDAGELDVVQTEPLDLVTGARPCTIDGDASLGTDTPDTHVSTGLSTRVGAAGEGAVLPNPCGEQPATSTDPTMRA